MPYIWHDGMTAPARSGAVCHELIAWPYRSLPVSGFVWFIAITAGLLLLPLLALLGSPVMWGVLPFILATLAGLWVAITRTYRSGATREVLHLGADRVELIRHDEGREDRCFEANPYWLRVALHNGPVEDYLTLSGDGREVELGAFLTPQERRKLDYELRERLRHLRDSDDGPI